MVPTFTRVFHFTVEEIAQERADGSNCREVTQFVPRRGEGRIDEVRGQLKCQTGHDPSCERQPDRPTIVVRRRRVEADPHNPDNRFERAKGDDCDPDPFDRERNVMGNLMQQRFH